MIKVVVQTRQRLFREGLALALDEEPDFEVVATATSAADLVAACAEVRPDVVVLEVGVAEWDAPRLIAALRNQRHGLRVIAVHDGRVSAPELWRAKRAGARATVPFSAGIEPLAMAVRARVVASLPSVIDLVTRQPLPDVSGALTPREIEVLECIAAGCNLREAGERLGISPKTVDNHKQRIFAKLGVQTQAHAISVAIRRGILASATQPEPISTGP